MNNAAIASPQLQPAPGTTTAPMHAYVAVLALFAIIYVGSAFSPHLQDDADSTHAEAAREMYVSGDYVTLHVNGNRYLEKAPLMYWLAAVSFRLFGINAFAAHFPTLLAMLLLSLLVMRWAARAYGGRAGVYAGLFTCTAVGYYLFTRILIPEAVLSLMVALALYCFATAMEGRGALRWYTGYACLALAVLTKGLLALVVVGGAVVVYLAISGEWRRWKEFHLGMGLLLFVAVAAPWHLLAGFRNPHFFWFYFVNEHFLRFLGERYPKDYNKLPASLYWTLHLVWLFPWSIFLPVAIRRIITEIKSKKYAAEPASQRIGFRTRTELLCLSWAGVMLAFFAFSTNQEYYTVPAYLPLLLLLAGAVAQEERAHDRRWLVATTAAVAVLSLAASALLIAGLWNSRNLPFVPDIGQVLAKPTPSAETLSMGHMLELTAASFAALRLPALLAAVGLALGSVLAFWLRARRRDFASTWAIAVTMVIFLIAAHIALVRFDPYLSSKSLATVIAQESRPGDRVMIFGDQAAGASLLFYLQRPIELVNGRTTSMWFGSTYPDAPKIFLDNAELARAWSSPGRVFLFVTPDRKPRVDAVLRAPKFVVAESSGKLIYSNRP